MNPFRSHLFLSGTIRSLKKKLFMKINIFVLQVFFIYMKSSEWEHEMIKIHAQIVFETVYVEKYYKRIMHAETKEAYPRINTCKNNSFDVGDKWMNQLFIVWKFNSATFEFMSIVTRINLWLRIVLLGLKLKPTEVAKKFRISAVNELFMNNLGR